MNNDLESVWKETVYFEVLFQNLPVERQKNHKIFSQNSSSPAMVLNLGPTEIRSRAANYWATMFD
jgi:hypothetical protein